MYALGATCRITKKAAYCARPSRATYPLQEVQVYEKPVVVRLGLLREVTQIGWNTDCDGGIVLGTTSVGDGEYWGCSKRTS